ncbi:hypothetical protein F4810DRAFT_712972 [Camillea tinctor]|nr:hypothetical protein F4810DRAFT_712972 [Camillea tinctor]
MTLCLGPGEQPIDYDDGSFTDRALVGIVIFNAERDRVLLVQSGLEITHFRGWAGTLSVPLEGEKSCPARIGKYFLAVETRNHDVKLNPEEHRRFIWATADEIKRGR